MKIFCDKPNTWLWNNGWSCAGDMKKEGHLGLIKNRSKKRRGDRKDREGCK